MVYDILGEEEVETEDSTDNYDTGDGTTVSAASRETASGGKYVLLNIQNVGNHSWPYFKLN